MATTETPAFDLSTTAQIGDTLMALVSLAFLVVPMFTVAVVVVANVRRDHVRAEAPWISTTSAGTRHLLGQTTRAEYRRSTRGDQRARHTVR